VASDVNAPDLVMKYYQKHLAVPRHICQTDFDAIFKSGTIASRHSNLGGRVNVRGPLTHNSRAVRAHSVRHQSHFNIVEKAS